MDLVGKGPVKPQSLDSSGEEEDDRDDEENEDDEDGEDDGVM